MQKTLKKEAQLTVRLPLDLHTAMTNRRHFEKLSLNNQILRALRRDPELAAYIKHSQHIS